MCATSPPVKALIFTPLLVAVTLRVVPASQGRSCVFSGSSTTWVDRLADGWIFMPHGNERCRNNGLANLCAAILCPGGVLYAMCYQLRGCRVQGHTRQGCVTCMHNRQPTFRDLGLQIQCAWSRWRPELQTYIMATALQSSRKSLTRWAWKIAAVFVDWAVSICSWGLSLALSSPMGQQIQKSSLYSYLEGLAWTTSAVFFQVSQSERTSPARSPISLSAT